MKKLVVLLTLSTLATATFAQETSLLNRLKSAVSSEKVTEQNSEQSMLNTNALVESLTKSLNVDTAQASGGLGAIFNYVKNNVSSEQFSQLSKSLPGVGDLLKKMPNIEQPKKKESSGGLGGLLSKAAEYNDSLKAVNDVKNQFGALGLNPEMISSFVNSAKTYLNTEEGKQAKQILTDGLGKLLG